MEPIKEQTSCKGCQMRHPTCHVDCEIYKKQWEKRKLIREGRDKYYLIDDSMTKSKNRMLKTRSTNHVLNTHKRGEQK